MYSYFDILIYIFSEKQSINLLLTDDFSKIRSHLDRKLDVMQLQLNEAHKFLSSQLKEESYINYTKLENSVYKLVNSKVPINEQERLEVTVNCLLESKQISVEKYEMLKTFIDLVVAKNLSWNQQNESVNTLLEASAAVKQMPANEDIFKQQKLLKQVINLMAERNVSLEKFRELETLIGVLAGSSISRDYMDTTLKDETMKRLDDLQRLSVSIQDINTTNCALKKRNAELQEFIDKMKEKNRPYTTLMDEEIRKQQIIIKAMEDESNIYKMNFETMMKEEAENLNKNIVQIIHKLLAEQIQ